MSPQMKYRRKVPGAMNFFSYFELVEGFSHMFCVLCLFTSAQLIANQKEAHLMEIV